MPYLANEVFLHMQKLNRLFKHRFGPLAVLAIIIFVLSFVVRLILMGMSIKQLDINFFQYLQVFIIGFLYDIVVFSFFAIPIALYCWLMKDSWYRSKWSNILLYFLFTIICFILVFASIGEVTFWNEFEVRYNFIAVDYLIYTTEVINNIIESYNIYLIVGILLSTSILIILLSRKKMLRSKEVTMRFLPRSQFFLLFMLLPTAGYFLMKNSFKEVTKNNYANELAGNGIYEFGAAFWHNEINYEQFYATQSDTANLSIVRSKLLAHNTSFVGNDLLSVERMIKEDSAAQPWNVIYISVESLSGEYLKRFGGTLGITPRLDSLVQHSLFFDNFYASGTRTVRGLEALSLAIPPTPGQSIVRRKDNENLFTIGGLLKQRDYDVRYIYGGNAFFDNMGAYFGGNGYDVIDESDIPKNLVKHTTAWGCDDEATFDFALEQCDKSFKNGKLFFNHIMTVSNHRPYTYPDGRIDIPSAEKSWLGAVKYTDYAIVDFLHKARKKQWFDKTIFVIVADHCSSSAGKTELPVNNYHIPCWIYAPALVQPRIENRYVSQIDLAPTVLGFLRQSYTSKFLGSDVYKRDSTKDRLFISTYQDLGYLQQDTMVVLSAQKKVKMYKVNFKSGTAAEIESQNQYVQEAIAWYQSAYFLYKNNKYILPNLR